MINGAGRLLARIFWATGLARLSRRMVAGGGRFVIELHGIPHREHPDSGDYAKTEITGCGLEQILRWITPRFRLLSAAEFLESDNPGILLTFDDGFANNHDVALPILERFQAPAVFFVTTGHLNGGRCRPGFVEDSMRSLWGDIDSVPRDTAREHFDLMDGDQITACVDSGLISIGSHSASHPQLTELDGPELEKEVRSSKHVLEDITGQPVDLFAYPFGDVDTRVAASVAAAGYRAAFAEGKTSVEQRSMAIPRIGFYQSESWYLAAQLSGVRNRPILGRILTN